MLSDVRAVTRPRSSRSGVYEATVQLVHSLSYVGAQRKNWHHGHGEPTFTGTVARKRQQLAVKLFQFSWRSSLSPLRLWLLFQQEVLSFRLLSVALSAWLLRPHLQPR